jgi:hypothetical protein
MDYISSSANAARKEPAAHPAGEKYSELVGEISAVEIGNNGWEAGILTVNRAESPAPSNSLPLHLPERTRHSCANEFHRNNKSVL